VLFRSREFNVLLTLAAIVVLIVASGPEAREAFTRASNLQNLTRQIALLAIFAIGETFVVISGGIDLSVGSMVAFSGVVTALCLDPAHLGLSAPAAALIAIGVCGLIGLAHALLISRFGLPPFVATLGSLLILRSVSLLLTDSVPIAIADDSLTNLGNGRVEGIPVPVLFLVAVAVPAVLLMKSTRWGRHLYALGGNEEAARLSGVNVERMKMLAYVLSGLFAGLAGVVFSGYLKQADPQHGAAYELYAIAAAVIGGCSLTGGEGSVTGTVLGASLLMVIVNAINLTVRKNATLWEGVIVGGIVLFAVAFNAFRQKRQGR
jgi:ribose transport system permease protein